MNRRSKKAALTKWLHRDIYIYTHNFPKIPPAPVAMSEKKKKREKKL